MKKVALLLVLFCFTGVVFAEEAQAPVTSKLTDKMREVSKKIDRTSNDIDAKVDAQTKLFTEEQRKYEKQKALRDEKLRAQQQKQQEILNYNQKKLEKKKQLLKQLLEE